MPLFLETHWQKERGCLVTSKSNYVIYLVNYKSYNLILEEKNGIKSRKEKYLFVR